MRCLTAERSVEYAHSLLHKGQSDAAIRYCRAVLAWRPADVEAVRVLAKAHGALGQPALAIEVLESAASQAPDLLIDLAEALAAQNKLDRAVTLLEECLRKSPADKAIAMRLAGLLIATNQPGRASTILERHADEPDARRLQGLALIACGNAAEARKVFLELENHSPNAQTAYDIGLVEGQLGSTEAESWMERAHHRDPSDFQSMLALGVMRLKRGAWSDAESLLRAAADRQAENALSHAYLALALHRLGRGEEAIEECELALHFDADLALGWYHYGLVEQAAGRHGDAIARFRRSIELSPDGAEQWAALGASCYESGEFLEAVKAYRRAAELRPADKKLFNNLGLAYREVGDFASSVACLEGALALDPQYVSAHSNLGLVAQDLGDIQRALGCFAEALRLDPACEEARWFAAVVRLREGLYQQGWPDYESRWLSSAARKISFRFPEWKNEPLAERTVLVYAEQGLGDQIMFSSCMAEIIGDAGLVVLECSRKLESLFRRSFPKALVFGSTTSDPAAPDWLPRLPRVDYQVPIGSLPLRYRRSRSDFTHHEGYLRADPAKVAKWRARLQDCGPGPYVGVSWQGGAPGTRRGLRSLPLAAFANLFRRLGASYFSLQYTDCAGEIESLRAHEAITVHHWQDAIDDYDQTAALVSALDLVISVCTSVIHLSGALARPAVVLVPFAAEWRYGRTGSEMPWYPSVHLVRQSEPGAWEGVLERAEDKARALLTGRH